MSGAAGGVAIRVAVQCAGRLRRECLAACVDAMADLTVVGRVAEAAGVLPLCELQRPDVLLTDAGATPGRNVGMYRLLRDRLPTVRVVVIYERLTAEELAELREAGVAAAVPHAHGLNSVLSVLRRQVAHPPPAAGSASALTDRQREILLLLASGHSAAEIADLLDISAATVESHKQRVYRKLHVTRAAEAVVRAASLGIVDGRRGPNGFDPQRLAVAEPGRLPVTLVVGDPGPVTDRVQATLIANRLPVVREPGPPPVSPMHWPRWHRGSILRVLVNPTARHWNAVAPTGHAPVVVYDATGPDPDLALQQGAAAVLHANDIAHQLVPVLTLVNRGYAVMPATVAEPLAEAARVRTAEPASRVPTLTPRELDILRCIGRSDTVRQTAAKLGIAVKTVENAQVHLFRKLGVHNRAAALTAAYALGLLHPSDVVVPDVVVAPRAR
ncbi:LuxR C-terminal-related transcriptional regulator [Rhizomonospora bruguierae]|uniref:LuxR C-terminal-related transcriptional regulator n=1 Tax=Rhizomonospora bruguierae TaxID=1581705 RepID=UPI001BCB1C6D|nr:LuxR C-terminal-related transcriptional regulator [Micromonospora sp. NBRC 107566]